MLIIFEDAKLKAQFKKFKRTGVIPEAIYAGQTIRHQECDSSVVFWAKAMLAIEAEDEYKQLIKNLQSSTSEFKLLYTLSRYRKGINPISALYEEFQRAQFKTKKDKFDTWIIDFCKDNAIHISNALQQDIADIKSFIDKYNKAGNEYLLHLQDLLEKFIKYLQLFNQLN